MSAPMTSAQRRALTARLESEAARHGLTLEHREQTKGRWVWDVRAGVTLAVHGATLAQLEQYLNALTTRPRA
jgi:hypothetical protein